MSAPTTHIHRLHLRHSGPARPETSQQVVRALEGLDLRPPDLPPSAVLLVRRLADPRPGRVSPSRRGLHAFVAWERAVREHLRDVLQSAARPRNGQIPASAEAVLFLDAAEARAGLVAARCGAFGPPAPLWWTPGLSRTLHVHPREAPAAILGAAPEALPAVWHVLETWRLDAPVRASLSKPNLHRLIAAAAQTMGVDLTPVGSRPVSIPDLAAALVDGPEFPPAPREPSDGTAGEEMASAKPSAIPVLRMLYRAPHRVHAVVRQVSRHRAASPPTTESSSTSPAPSTPNALSALDAPVPDPPVSESPFPDASSAPPSFPDSKGATASDAADCDAQSPTHAADVSANALEPSAGSGSDGEAVSSSAPRSHDAPARASQSSDVPEESSPEASDAVDDPPSQHGSPSSDESLARAPEARAEKGFSSTPDPAPASKRREYEGGQAAGPKETVPAKASPERSVDASPGVPQEPSTESEVGSEAAASEARVVQTAFGGVMYLVNVMDALDWPAADPFEASGAGMAPHDVQGRAWALLEGLAKRLLGLSGAIEARRDDPLWRLLAALDGRDPGVPGPDAVVTAWVDAVSPFLETRVAAALGVDPSGLDWDDLLRLDAVIRVTPLHLDILLALNDIRLDVRRAGLDRDPGWTPAFGRVIRLHFQ